MSTPDRDLAHLYPEFEQKMVRVWNKVNIWCMKHQPDYRVQHGEGYRSQLRQMELYAQGRTTHGPIVTKLDGVHSKSSHQSSMAEDTWVTRRGVVVWDAVPWDLYEYYGHCCREEGLTWGGDWDGDQKSSDEKFVDAPHAEWDRKDHEAYRQAALWQARQRAKKQLPL